MLHVVLMVMFFVAPHVLPARSRAARPDADALLTGGLPGPADRPSLLGIGPGAPGRAVAALQEDPDPSETTGSLRHPLVVVRLREGVIDDRSFADRAPTLFLRARNAPGADPVAVAGGKPTGPGEFVFQRASLEGSAVDPEDGLWIEARAPGYAPAGSLWRGADDPDAVVLELAAAREALVHVREPTGAPVAGAVVTAVPLPAAGPLDDVWCRQVVTDPRGEARLHDLAEGMTYRVFARATGGGIQPMGRAADTLAADAQVLDIVLARARIIWCRAVSQADNQPLNTVAWRVLERSTAALGDAHRSAGDRGALGLPHPYVAGDLELLLVDGTSEDDAMPTAVVRAFAPGFEPMETRVAIPRLDDAVARGPEVIALRSAGPLGTLEVASSAAHGVLALPISVVSTDDPGLRVSRVLQVGGTSEPLRMPLPPGRYEVAVVGVPLDQRVDVTAGQTSRVLLPQEAWKCVQVRVRGRDGQPPRAVALTFAYAVAKGPQVLRDESPVLLDERGTSSRYVFPRSGRVLLSVRELESGLTGGGAVDMDAMPGGSSIIDVELAP